MNIPRVVARLDVDGVAVVRAGVAPAVGIEQIDERDIEAAVLVLTGMFIADENVKASALAGPDRYRDGRLPPALATHLSTMFR